ncbi:glucokinase [Arthrobacter sp. 1088]|uniref:ROK family transcriptional regulator n=1 Tax=Arthrobacter sp. 1088 TaxID=2817768 RepID=UPI00285D5F88|nr:ROK family transcriptional regulator [Arthrobacter sp. 1088]MDR6685736.1 glucokinase [Arthrobacter sp. 1088]
MQSPKATNRSAVLAEVLRAAPASRKQVAEATGISSATVTRVVDQLLAEGVLREGSEIVSENRGRRAVLLDLVADRSYVLGIDLGASNTRFILADLNARPVLVCEVQTPSDLDTLRLADWLAGEVRSACGKKWPLVDSICMGLPGAVSRVDGSVSNATHLPQVDGTVFLEAFEGTVQLKLLTDNDANLALLGEQRFGAARTSPTAAMLTLGTGLGAGLAIDGNVLKGSHGLIGEFGQLPIGPLGGRLEHMVTGPGILQRAHEAGLPLNTPADLFAENAGHLHSLRAHFDHALMIVLTAISVSCDPETIVLGGGIAKSLTTSLSRYQATLERNLRVSPTLVPAELGDFSGAAGAVVSSLRAIYADLGIQPEFLADLPATQALTPSSIGKARMISPQKNVHLGSI